MLQVAIAAGFIVGPVVGLAASATESPVLPVLAEAFRMVVIPLIVAVILASIASLGDPRKRVGSAIVLGIDRIPDMMRSVVNIPGQVAAVVCVDRWTGGKPGSE